MRFSTDKQAGGGVDGDHDQEQQPVEPRHRGAEGEECQRISHPVGDAGQGFAQDRHVVSEPRHELARDLAAQLCEVERRHFVEHVVLQVAQGGKRNARIKPGDRIHCAGVYDAETSDGRRPDDDDRAEIGGRPAFAGKPSGHPFDSESDGGVGGGKHRHGGEREGQPRPVAGEIIPPQPRGEGHGGRRSQRSGGGFFRRLGGQGGAP